MQPLPFASSSEEVSRSGCTDTIARWPGTRAELYELQALPQLALLEYRDECDKLIARDKEGTLELAGEGCPWGSVGCGVAMLLAVAGAALARRGLG